MFHEFTPEDEEGMIRKAAELIHKWRMETPVIMMLESTKHLVYIGGQMGRFFIYPWIFMLGDKFSLIGDKFFTVFEKRENVEQLITLLEEMGSEKSREKEQAREGAQPKRGWRRFLPRLLRLIPLSAFINDYEFRLFALSISPRLTRACCTY